MKKTHRKDVIMARVIFAAICLALIAIITTFIVIGVNASKKSKGNKQTETQTEIQTEPQTQTQVDDIEPFETETEEIPEVVRTDAWTTDLVRFREEPNTDCEVLANIPRNTSIVTLYEENGWYRVEYNGEEGYVSADYLTFEEPTTNGIVVCIDPGHQASGDSTQEPNGPNSSNMKARVTGGTSGRFTGVMEYELNLQIGLALRDELEARGYTVVMTRESHAVNISNMERAQFATNQGADISVRIHANGSDDASVSGALALAPSASNPYVSYLASDSQTLSQCVLNSYCAATGMNNQGVIANDTMTGINWCTVPVTILEMGYMTNSNDDYNMQDPGFQAQMVQGIANGIDAYFGL